MAFDLDLIRFGLDGLIEINGFRASFSPVSMDNDLGWEGNVEVGRLLGDRLLVEHLCTVHVSPRQQQVLDLQFDSLLPVALPGGVVEVGTLMILLPFLYTWLVLEEHFSS